MLLKMIKTFGQSECGAITVDFVVLTSGTVVMGVAVLMAISGGLHNGSDSIDEEIVNTVSQAGIIGTQISGGN